MSILDRIQFHYWDSSAYPGYSDIVLYTFDPQFPGGGGHRVAYEELSEVRYLSVLEVPELREKIKRAYHEAGLLFFD